MLPHALPLRSEPYTLTLFMPACAVAPVQAAGAAAAALGPGSARFTGPDPGSAGPAAPHDRDRGAAAGGSGGTFSLGAQQADGVPRRDEAERTEPYTCGGSYFLVPADDAAAADAGELQRRAHALAAGLPNPRDGPQPAGKQRASVPAAAQSAPGADPAEQPGTAPAAAAARPGREPRRPAQRALNASPLRGRKGAARRGDGGGSADPGCGGSVAADARPLRDRAHKLQAWFGARVFALLEPGSFSRVCLDEQARRGGAVTLLCPRVSKGASAQAWRCWNPGPSSRVCRD